MGREKRKILEHFSESRLLDVRALSLVCCGFIVSVVIIEPWAVAMLSLMVSVAVLLVVILLLCWLMFHTVHFCRYFIIVGVVSHEDWQVVRARFYANVKVKEEL